MKAFLRTIVESTPRMDVFWKNVCSPEVVAVSVLFKRSTMICKLSCRNTSIPENGKYI